MIGEEGDERLAARVINVDSIVEEALEGYRPGVAWVDAVVAQSLHAANA